MLQKKERKNREGEFAGDGNLRSMFDPELSSETAKSSSNVGRQEGTVGNSIRLVTVNFANPL